MCDSSHTSVATPPVARYIMKRIPLRSKSGCSRCRSRRRKCDETKPFCNECIRLGFKCRWQDASHVSDAALFRNGSSGWLVAVDGHAGHENIKPRNSTLHLSTTVELQRRNTPTFDHPVLLQSSTNSIANDEGGKHVLQYLWEQGHSILKYPTQRYPAAVSINSWRVGYVVSNSPTQVEAYLCLGAVYLSKLYPQYEKKALRHYNNVIWALRSELQSCELRPPAEWVCAVAAILSRYEMIVYSSPQSRLAHLCGFHFLVEARLRWKQPWGQLRLLLEHYIHSLSDNSLFHHSELVRAKSFAHVDDLILILNERPRPLGRELVGVPEILTVIVYKLAFLNWKDVSQSPWDVELTSVEASIRNWEPSSHMLLPRGASLLLIGKLYHLACHCLVLSISCGHANLHPEMMASYVKTASGLIQQSDLGEHPSNSLAWPLTILGIFAVDCYHANILKQPIESLVQKSRLKGYTSVLAFLSQVDREGLGPSVFRRPDILSLVHI